MSAQPCFSAVSVEAPSGVLFRTPSRAEQPAIVANSNTPQTQEAGSRCAATNGSTAAVAGKKRAGAGICRLVQHTCTPVAASLARKQKGGAARGGTRACRGAGNQEIAEGLSPAPEDASSPYQKSPSSHPAARVPPEGGASISSAPSVPVSTQDEMLSAAFSQQREGLLNGSHNSSSHRVNIKVLVRCRPMTKEERQSGCSVVDVAPERKEVTVRFRKSCAVRTGAAASFSASSAAATAGPTQKLALLQNSQNTSSSTSANAGLDQGFCKVFRFDGVCSADATQHQLFEEHVRPLVDDVLQGFNCTVFAYGQTGTGKTFTIEGAAPHIPSAAASNSGGEEESPNASLHTSVSPLSSAAAAAAASSKAVAAASPSLEAGETKPAAASDAGGAATGAENATDTAPLASSCCLANRRSSGTKTDTLVSPASECGLIPRAVDHIFATLRQQRDSEDFTVSCSFLEIYNEELIDLFAAASPTLLHQGNTSAEGTNGVASGSQSGVPSKETRTASDASSTITAASSCSSRPPSSATASSACRSPLPTTSGSRLRIYEEPAAATPTYVSAAPESSSFAVSAASTLTSTAGGALRLCGSATPGGWRAAQQSSRGAIKVEGLEDKEVKSPEEVFALLRAAAPRRAFARSSMNAHSSRSHTVFSISVCVRETVRTEENSPEAADSGGSVSSTPRGTRRTGCSSGSSGSTNGCKSSSGRRRSTTDVGSSSSSSSGSAVRKGVHVDFAGAAIKARRGRRGGGGSADALADVCGRTGALPVEEVFRVGKLNLVDLAGSENVHRSWGGTGTAAGAAASGGGNAEEKRRRECTLINKSLLTLGRCINALVEHASHIPYRDSKLTRLLQDSLGGCTKTCLIATISPAEDVVEETLNTLNYAYRAKSIQNLPVKTLRHSKSSLLSSLLAQNQQLQVLLASQRERDGVFMPVPLFQQQQQQHALLQQQSQEQQRDIASLQEQIEALQEVQQRMRQSIEEHDAEKQQLQQQTQLLQSELVAAKGRQQELEQHLQAAQKQQQALAKRLSEKIKQHVSATATAAADLRRALQEATLLERHQWILQKREQRVRHTCERSAAVADATCECLQQQLQELHERLQGVLAQLERSEAARAEAAAAEETLIRRQQQEELRVLQEQQQLRAKALLQVQQRQYACRRDRDQQLRDLTSALTAFAAECSHMRTETAERGSAALQQLQEKQQRAAEKAHAKLQQQLELQGKASKDLQQLLLASSSTCAADAERTCTSLRELVQQVEEWQLRQQRLLEEGAAAVAAAVQQQLQKFAQEQRAQVEEHSRKVQLHIQDVQQVTLQKKEAAAANAAAAAAAAAAAEEVAASLAKAGETGVNTLLEEVQAVRAAAAVEERDKGSAADRAAADRCDQLQRQIKATSIAEKASEEEVDAGLCRVQRMDQEALASAAAAAASNAEAWQQQRGAYTKDASAAAAAFRQEASAAAAALHSGSRRALTEQHALTKECTTRILAHVLQPPPCVSGVECVYGREPPSTLQQEASDAAPTTNGDITSSAAPQQNASSVGENTDSALRGVCQRGSAGTVAGASTLCSWCLAAAAGRWWFSARDGRGAAAAAEATAAAAAAAEELAAAETPQTDRHPQLKTTPEACAPVVDTALHVVVGTSSEPAAAGATVDVLLDAAESVVSTEEDILGVVPGEESCVMSKETLKREKEQAHSTKEAPAFLATATLLQDQTTGREEGMARGGRTAHPLDQNAKDGRCVEPHYAHCRADAEAEMREKPPMHAAAEQQSCGAYTSRSRNSEEGALETAKGTHGAECSSRTERSTLGSSRSTDETPLPSRSTTSSTTSSTPTCCSRSAVSRCSSSAASRSSSSVREERACKSFRLSYKGDDDQRSGSTESHCELHTTSDAADRGSKAPSEQLQRHDQNTQQQQQECKDLKATNSYTAPAHSVAVDDVRSSHKWSGVEHQQSQQYQCLHPRTKQEDGLQQGAGASLVRDTRVKHFPLAKKRGPESDISKRRQERARWVERQQQCRNITKEPQRQPHVQRYQQREKLPTQDTSSKGGRQDVTFGNACSGAVGEYKYMRAGKAALSQPTPQSTSLRRSRLDENVAHLEVDKRKKIHSDAPESTHFATHSSVKPPSEEKGKPSFSPCPAGRS